MPGDPSMSSTFVGFAVVCGLCFLDRRALRRLGPFVLLLVLAAAMAAGDNTPIYRGLRRLIPPLGYSRFPSSDYRGAFAILAILLAAAGWKALRRRPLPSLEVDSSGGVRRVGGLEHGAARAVARVRARSGGRLRARGGFAPPLAPRARSAPAVGGGAPASRRLARRRARALAAGDVVRARSDGDLPRVPADAGAPGGRGNRREPERLRPAERTASARARRARPGTARAATSPGSTTSATSAARSCERASSRPATRPRWPTPPARGCRSSSRLPRRETTDAEIPDLASRLSSAKPDSRVEQVLYGADRIGYRVRLERPALVVENEIYFPGWSARVAGPDGTARVVDAVRVNGVWRGWPLPAGEYELDARFRLRGVRDPGASDARRLVGWTIWVAGVGSGARGGRCSPSGSERNVLAAANTFSPPRRGLHSHSRRAGSRTARARTARRLPRRRWPSRRRPPSAAPRARRGPRSAPPRSPASNASPLRDRADGLDRRRRGMPAALGRRRAPLRPRRESGRPSRARARGAAGRPRHTPDTSRRVRPSASLRLLAVDLEPDAPASRERRRGPGRSSRPTARAPTATSDRAELGEPAGRHAGRHAAADADRQRARRAARGRRRTAASSLRAARRGPGSLTTVACRAAASTRMTHVRVSTSHQVHAASRPSASARSARIRPLAPPSGPMQSGRRRFRSADRRQAAGDVDALSARRDARAARPRGVSEAQLRDLERAVERRVRRHAENPCRRARRSRGRGSVAREPSAVDLRGRVDRRPRPRALRAERGRRGHPAAAPRPTGTPRAPRRPACAASFQTARPTATPEAPARAGGLGLAQERLEVDRRREEDPRRRARVGELPARRQPLALVVCGGRELRLQQVDAGTREPPRGLEDRVATRTRREAAASRDRGRTRAARA